jgi:UDP-N-acetylglucosamine 1-carboxyvinyltransferase
VNLHIEGLKKLGAEIDLEAGYVVARAPRLHGARITFDISSVGATGNVMMAAALAEGSTLIQNAALEPEITHLGLFLNRMGARISGLGTSTLEIEGVDRLQSASDDNIPDRIEAGTFLAAAAMTGGDVTLAGCGPDLLEAVTGKLEETGCEIRSGAESITLRAPEKLAPVDVTTAIYPGFPTDMQAQWMTLMSLSSGSSMITDTVYHDRFNHIPELQRLGADIRLNENSAVVRGVPRLRGAKVMSTDLRASASLILAGLAAEGETEVLRIYHIDRGYESIETKLNLLGARIERVRGEEY